MQFTTGNDTVSIIAGTTDIDGLAGDDLLYLTGPSTLMGQSILLWELRADTPEGTLRLVALDNTGTSTVVLEQVIAVRNIETFDITAPIGTPIDVWTGNGNDRLRGGDLNDGFRPGGGLNLIYGGFGNDGVLLTPRNGIDRVYGGNGDDGVAGADQTDIIDGGPGVDTLQVTLAGWTTGWRGDTAPWYANPNWTRIETVNLTLTDHNDLLRVTAILGMLDGGGGDDDVLILNRLTQTAVDLDVSNGSDGISGFERFRLIGSARADRFFSGAGDDTLDGLGGNDTLYTGGGRDQILGGAGNDILYDIDLNDTVSGGSGYDLARVDFSAATAGVVLGGGQNAANHDGIEEYAGVLTGFDDTYHATYVSRAGQGIDAGDGYDRLVLDLSRLHRDFTGTFTRLETGFGSLGLYRSLASGGQEGSSLHGWEEVDFTGSSRPDEVLTGLGNDTLRGEGGNDTLSGGGGINQLYGGSGNDLIIIGPGSQTLAHGGTGDDVFRVEDTGHSIDGASGTDRVELTLFAQTTGVTLTLAGTDGRWTGIEQVTGYLTTFDDTADMGFLLGTGPVADGQSALNGSGGHDTLILDYSTPGRASHVFVSASIASVTLADGSLRVATFDGFEVIQATGSAGDDVLTGGSSASRLSGIGGNDTLNGGFGTDLINGGDGDDSLVGNVGNDTLRGDGGNDLIRGGDGNDLIEGGDGDDAFAGDAGNDRMFGGAGSDLFFFDGLDDSGSDTITGYDDTVDLIWISGGLTVADVTARVVGPDLLVFWAAGSLIVRDVTAPFTSLLFDADFL
jgi:Ca2+-binding RTX toxin-like protein